MVGQKMDDASSQISVEWEHPSEENKGEERDRSRGDKNRTKKPDSVNVAPRIKTSARAMRAGELLVTGQEKTRYRALVAAGYSPNTACRPSANGFTTEGLMVGGLRALQLKGGGDKIEDLTPLAVATIKSMLEDESKDDGLRLNAAVAVQKLTNDKGVEEKGKEHARSDMYRGSLIVLRACRRVLEAVYRDPGRLQSFLEGFTRAQGKAESRLSFYLELEAVERKGVPRYNTQAPYQE